MAARALGSIPTRGWIGLRAVGARIARPGRVSGLSWRVRWLRKAICTAAPPKAPLCKGPQGSAACGRASDRSGPAATCLGGPQRGPGRFRGNPEVSRQSRDGGDQNHRSPRALWRSAVPNNPSVSLRLTAPLTQGSLFCAARRRVHIASARQRIRCAARAAASRPYGSEAHFFTIHSTAAPLRTTLRLVS